MDLFMNHSSGVSATNPARSPPLFLPIAEHIVDGRFDGIWWEHHGTDLTTMGDTDRSNKNMQVCNISHYLPLTPKFVSHCSNANQRLLRIPQVVAMEDFPPVTEPKSCHVYPMQVVSDPY